MTVITRPPVMGATRRLRRHEAVTGFAFVLPSVVGFVVFVLGPLVAAFVIGFTEYDIVTSPEWVGLENFRRLWRDDRLRETYVNTVVYVVCAVVLINVIGLALAVMVNRRMPGWARTVLRSVYFFPSLIGLTYVSIIWQAMFQKDTGVVNHYLSEVGGPRIDWLNDERWSVVSVVIVDTWRNVGLTMLIYVSALQNVPRSLLEAAEIDGAGRWRSFRSVTLPMISPSVFFNVTMVMIGAFQIYESVIVLTGGGPGDASRSVVMYLAEQGFQQYNMGYASAIGTTLFLIIVSLTLVQFGLRKRWVHFE
jgi:multiple sugar transport system permease protein